MVLSTGVAAVVVVELLSDVIVMLVGRSFDSIRVGFESLSLVVLRSVGW
jgi:hypothetical protein